MWRVPEESNLTGSPFTLTQPMLRSPLSILLQHPEPPVGTIPRTPITPIQINTIKSRPFISNLISIPFLNFLAIVKDKVESNHNRPQIKDYERRRIPRRLWCECSYRTFQKTLSYQRFFGFQSCRFPCFYFTSRTGSA